jgi:iron complex outermembrane receptor protein
MIPVEPEQGNACEGRCNASFSIILLLQDVQAGFFQKNQAMTHIKILLAIIFFMPLVLSAQTDKQVEDSLKRSALFLEPVEVKAIRAPENAPFAKTTITKKDIKKANLGQDLTYILNQTPSVIINSDAGNGVGYTGFRIRGSDATRTNMTINGIPYNDAESQGLFFVNLPDFVSSVGDIQIQRGIGASSNGAGAFGASMNFSTNEVNVSPYAEINNTAGSYNTWKHTIRAGSGLINDHFTIDARLSKISSDGYIDRAETDLRSYYLSGAYITGKSSIRLNVFSGEERTYQAWNGIPSADLKNNRTKNYSGTEKPGTPYDDETDNYQQDHYQLFFNHRFHSRLTFNTALFLTRGKGYYENYKAGQSFSDYGLNDFISGEDTISQTDLVRQLWLDNYYYGQTVSLQYRTDHGFLTAGGGWNRYDGDHYGEVIWANVGFPVKHRWYDLEARKSDVNVYTKYQHKLTERLEIFGDAQYRRVDYNIGGFRNNPALFIHNIYDFLNPKAGLTYSVNGARVYASYAFASKEPNRDDFEAGVNQQPKPERMHNVEAGIEKKYKRWYWNANLYYMKYRDQLIPTGRINDVGAYTRINIPKSFRAGIELIASGSINSWLTAGANLTLSRNRLENFTEYYDDYDNGGQKSNFYPSSDIAFSPSVTGGATLGIKPFKNAEINLIGKYISRQYLDNTSNKERSLDGYYVQDARISYAVPNKLVKGLNVVFQVNNVFNKKYEANGYTFSYLSEGSFVTENYYFPQAGTNLLFAVNVEL